MSLCSKSLPGGGFGTCLCRQLAVQIIPPSSQPMLWGSRQGQEPAARVANGESPCRHYLPPKSRYRTLCSSRSAREA